ncbi:flagellar hook-associated protein FlgL [Desulfotomaculum copahuensis]|uniref:Flagellar hook-associated protein 3 n=1 Tax=Desulfotomaculum copahuensis TaxID=1838280 RepID=A0A1B7LCA8_9FIRM|nr:flagellar hook-associated protein FlgL [Desulfotomaculum copahuensis]OAT80374.1 flagellar hook-associated protein 3 [Desulfotomaculum copahuensis]
MRITNQMTATLVLNDLNNCMEQLQNTQLKLSSGHNINQPSDDPAGTARVMAYNTALSANGQYQRNINDASGWLKTTDQALANIGSALQRVRTLTVEGANATLTGNDRQALAQEVDQLINNVADNANASYGSRYIFGGNHTGGRPFTVNNDANGEPQSVTYTGDQGQLNYEISQNVTMQINVNADSSTSGNIKMSDIFSDLINIRDHLKNSDTNSLSGSDLSNLDRDMNNLLSARASVGARLNRLSLSLGQAQTANLNLTGSKADIYDVDIARAITDFNMQQNAYQGALNVAARIIQPTLVDFLK